MKALSRTIATGIFATVYLLSRAPLALMGYGSEADSWAVALAGRYWRDTGSYHMSRLPGHPAAEFVSLSVATVGGGAALSNAVNVGLSILLLVLLRRLLTDLGLSPWRAALGVVVVAFHPIFWIASTSSTDYIPAALCLLAALSALERAPAVAGILLGLGAAFRAETAAAAVVLSVVAVPLGGSCLRRFLGGFAATLALLYSPVYLRYGAGMFATYLPESWPFSARAPQAGARLVGLSGHAATLVALGGLAVWLFRDRGWEKLWMRSVLTITLIAAYPLAILAWHPTKTSILFPTLVFGLALAAYAFRPFLFVTFGILSLVYGFYHVDLLDADGLSLKPAFHVSPGALRLDTKARRQAMALHDEVGDYPFPRHTVVYTGFWHSALIFEAVEERGALALVHPDLTGRSPIEATLLYDSRRDVYFAHLFDAPTLAWVDEAGYKSYALRGVPDSYPPERVPPGAVEVPVPGDPW